MVDSEYTLTSFFFFNNNAVIQNLIFVTFKCTYIKMTIYSNLEEMLYHLRGVL